MSDSHQQDARYMQQACVLAAKAINPAPNPRVGAIVVRAGQIVGRGYHTAAGQLHAEVVALRQAGTRAIGATLYVTLEPCTHYGRTPPCVDAILESSIARVAIGLRDPTLRAGGGAEFLKKNNVRVRTGVCVSECRALNQVWLKSVTTKLPYITLKLALDSTGSSIPKTGTRWITGVSARQRVQRQRAEHDAVLVGVGTVVADDPRLTVRGALTQPTRIILDPTGRIPRTARLLRETGRTIVVTRRPVRVRGASNLVVPRFGLKTILKKLYANGIASIYVEGGLTTARHFAEAELVDRLYVFVADSTRSPRLWGKALRLRHQTKEKIGPDVLWSGDLSNY